MQSIEKPLKKLAATGAMALAAATFASSALAVNYGEPGEPVELTIGYQPYYTQSWSGVAMRGKEFWKKYLPEGSEINFQIGLQGSVIVNAMLAGQQHIGYMGDMPAIVSTYKRRVDDIRIVSNLGIGKDQCNIMMVRNDAPAFESGAEAVKWMDGKRTAVPQGACTDRFFRLVFDTVGIEPAAYLNQNIEVMSSGFRGGRLDAGAIWEPTATKLVLEGKARRVASGADVGGNDGGFMVMRKDLIDQRPDVALAWVRAELDAIRWVVESAQDPEKADELVTMAANQTEGLTKKQLWWSLYGPYPKDVGGVEMRNRMPFSLDEEEVLTLLDKASNFLHEVESVNSPDMPEGAVYPKLARKALKKAGLPNPLPKDHGVRAIEDVPDDYREGVPERYLDRAK
jgi:NitT/TauT family transport system substrate-binding protein